MSLLILCGLTALTLICLPLKKKRYAAVFCCLALFGFYWIWSGLPAQLALERLQTHPHLEHAEWKQKNVIVVLGFGAVRWSPEHVSSQAMEYTRLYEGARLYFQCKQTGAVCHVLVTGGDPLRLGVAEAVIMAEELHALRIPLEDLIIEPESRNTFQNARLSAPLIEEGAYGHAVLVTSATHMRRAQLFFTHFGVTAESAPSNHLNPLRSFSVASRNFFLLDVALHEYGGILQYHWYNFMGWNPPKKT